MFNVVMINFALPGKRVFYMVFLFLLFGFLNANAVVVMVDAKDVFSDGFGEKCSRFIFYENNTHSINVNALFFERKGVFFLKDWVLGVSRLIQNICYSENYLEVVMMLK